MSVSAPKPVMLGQNAVLPDAIDELGPKFWESVKFPNGLSGCWEVQRTTKKGYGLAYIGKSGLIHKEFVAHRLLFFFNNPDADQSLMCLHRCDNRRCCNPAHIFLGTAQDNTDDMIAKGRANYARGERAGCAKFNAQIVHEVRRLYATGLGYRKVGQLTGVSRSHVKSIVIGRAWAHLPEEAAA